MRAVTQKENVHDIYPEYYLIKVNQFNDVAKDTLDEWIYFLKNEKIEDHFKAKGLAEAKKRLDSLKLSAAERQDYDRYLEVLRHDASMVESNYGEGRLEGERIGLEKGRSEGEKIGMEKGRSEGEKIGMEKGKVEGKIEVAKQLKKLGFSIKNIQAATGLDRNELESL